MRFDRDQIDRGSLFDRAGGLGYLASLSAYLDTDSDIYAIIELGSLKAYLDTDSDVYATLAVLSKRSIPPKP